MQSDCHSKYCFNEPSKVQVLRRTSKQTRTMTMMMTTTTTTVMNNDQNKLCQNHYRHCVNTNTKDNRKSTISSKVDGVNNSLLKVEIKDEDIVPLSNSGILYNNSHHQYHTIEDGNVNILSHL